MSASQTVYLISGANRGIGLGLVESLSKDGSNIVIGGTRHPSKSSGLNDLAKERSNVHVVKLTSADVSDNKAAAKSIEEKFGRLDVVIANAGISNDYTRALDVSIEQVDEHYKVNTIGPLVLFQAVGPLLLKSPNPKWVLISTAAASLGAPFPLLVTAYGASKAAANFINTKIHQEHENLVVLTISPGWVQTDAGNFGASSVGMKEAPMTIADSVSGILKVVHGGTRAESGKFWDQEGKELQW
ncbi:hypothetical protein FRB94_011596 [Tulasnella sp. JGI-2019a]|nr:hypothetical protein FRB93_010112 [Tulasnella sp. JGI-2019a]KAG8992472.1 hypothetical protein FRB94_011596 [Tulasnella sp. JGI-2019a]KAG9024439.1 hypothetical protein FRB95_011524 [Tulasnella sp. JGI-2019a]